MVLQYMSASERYERKIAYLLSVEVQAVVPDQVEIGLELGFGLVSLQFDILGHCHEVHWPRDDWGVSKSGWLYERQRARAHHHSNLAPHASRQAYGKRPSRAVAYISLHPIAAVQEGTYR